MPFLLPSSETPKATSPRKHTEYKPYTRHSERGGRKTVLDSTLYDKLPGMKEAMTHRNEMIVLGSAGVRAAAYGSSRWKAIRSSLRVIARIMLLFLAGMNLLGQPPPLGCAGKTTTACEAQYQQAATARRIASILETWSQGMPPSRRDLESSACVARLIPRTAGG